MSATSRRDAWLTIALLVAREGLPAPQMLVLSASGLEMHVGVADADEHAAWVTHLGGSDEQFSGQPTSRGHVTHYSRVRVAGERATVWHETTSVVPVPQSPLAAEVVAAIPVAPTSGAVTVLGGAS